MTNQTTIFYFETMLKNANIEFQKEVVFSKIMPTKRKFRADYYLPELKTIVEINGGQFVNGRHNRGGKGYENDLIKSNMASLNGFFYLQYTYQMLKETYINDVLLIKAKQTIKNIVK